jgi:hypothetical protein
METVLEVLDMIGWPELTILGWILAWVWIGYEMKHAQKTEE